MSDQQDWEQVLAFLKPKPPLYCPEAPSPTQQAFLRYYGKEALYGGAAGGGKSSALLMGALQYVDIPGYSAMLFRRTFADLALPGALMDRFKMWIGEYEDVRWNDSTYTATFPSGARVSFGYLNNVNDRLRYQGAEFQYVGFDEVTHIRQSDYKYLHSRLRKPNSGPLSKVPLRVRAACNPAPNWVRQHFLVEGEQNGIIFVPAFLEDNPGVDIESYRQMLQGLDPLERQQLEFGDWWASSSGTLFDRNNFVQLSPTDIPEITSAARACRFWDLAGTPVSESNRDPDWTVGTLGVFDNGVFYVLDVQRIRAKGEDVEKLIKKTAETDGKLVAIRMEQEPGSSGKNLIDQYARYVLPGYDFQGIRASGDKTTRARPFASAAANGNVRILQAPWMSAWLDEFSAFPEACDHDDQVDSAVGCFNHLTGLGLPQRGKVTIIV